MIVIVFDGKIVKTATLQCSAVRVTTMPPMMSASINILEDVCVCVYIYIYIYI